MALFNALRDKVEMESGERHMVERQFLVAEIKNIMMVEGPKRMEVMKAERWGDELRRAGFHRMSLTGNPAMQASLLLGMFPSKGYMLVEEGDSTSWGRCSLSYWCSPVR